MMNSIESCSVNISGEMKESLCANSTPAKPVIAAEIANDLDLVERDVDTHAACRGLAVADRDEGAPCRRAQQVERADNGQHQHRKAEEIEGRAVAETVTPSSDTALTRKPSLPLVTLSQRARISSTMKAKEMVAMTR